MTATVSLNLWDRIVRWFHGTAFYEIAEHLVQVYFTVQPVEYEKIKLTAAGAATVRNIILAIAFGVILSAIGIFYTRRYPGGFVRALLKAGAHTPEDAKTLEELGYLYSVGIRWDIRRGGVLTRTVVRAGDPEPPVPMELREESVAEETSGDKETSAEKAEKTESVAKPKIEALRPFDFTTDRFYIPEVLRYRAQVRYTQKGSGVLPLILTVLFSIVGCGLLCRFLPALLALIDKIL